MDEAQQQQAREVFEAWKKSLQDTQDARNYILRILREEKLSVIEQKRKLFRTVIELSIGIIVAPVLLGITQNKTYYYVGLSILSFVIIFIVLTFREIIDVEFENLQKSEDDIVAVLENKISIVKKYLKAGNYTYDENEKQYTEIVNSSETKKLVNLDNKLKSDRENRDNLPKDYSGELIMFLFISGIFWILLGIFPEYMYWPFVVLGELLIFLVTSTNSMWLIAKTFSVIQNFLRMKISSNIK